MKRLLWVFLLSACCLTASAANYYTIAAGYYSSPSIWQGGNVPNFTTAGDSVFIRHNINTGTGYWYVRCYVKVEMYAVVTSPNLSISSDYGYVEVWGSIYIKNKIEVYNGGVMIIYYGGFVKTDTKVDVGGSSNPGQIILHGGTICYRTQWFGDEPVADGDSSLVLHAFPSVTHGECYFYPGPLSVTLLSFEVACSGRMTKISWVTENEENNDHFTVERSHDLVTWVTVASVAGSLTSQGLKQYQVYDNNPSPGTQYYRLSQTDTDGTLTIFNDQWLRVSQCLLEMLLNLAPNPAGEFIVVKNADIERMSFHLVDMFGRQRISGWLEVGDNTLDLSNLNKGIYLIQTQYGSNYKFIKE